MPAGYNVEDFGGEDRQRLREVLAEALGVPLELLHITNVRGSESVAAGGSQRRFLQAVTILVDYNIDLLEIDQATQPEIREAPQSNCPSETVRCPAKGSPLGL